MKTVVLGFSDIDGKGPTKLLAGVDVPQPKQVLLVTGIKTSGKYPEGLVRVSFCEVIERNIGVCIKTANELKAKEAAARAKREKAFEEADKARRIKEQTQQGIYLIEQAKAAEKAKEQAKAQAKAATKTK